jgi:hypothetical protein
MVHLYIVTLLPVLVSFADAATSQRGNKSKLSMLTANAAKACYVCADLQFCCDDPIRTAALVRERLLVFGLGLTRAL